MEALSFLAAYRAQNPASVVNPLPRRVLYERSPSIRGVVSSCAQQLSTAEMVKALDQRPEARRPYRRLYDRAARADEPRIHRRRGTRVSLGRRELISGAADLRREAASHAY